MGSILGSIFGSILGSTFGSILGSTFGSILSSKLHSILGSIFCIYLRSTCPCRIYIQCLHYPAFSAFLMLFLLFKLFSLSGFPILFSIWGGGIPRDFFPTMGLNIIVYFMVTCRQLLYLKTSFSIGWVITRLESKVFSLEKS